MKSIIELISIIEHKVKIIDIIDRLGIIGYDLLELLSENNIGYIENGIIRFNKEDRVRLAILALRYGIDIKEIAKVLSWRDFEYFASMILKTYGYNVYNNIRVKRLEIDILAIDEITLLIDCKHWRYNNLSNLRKAIEKQLKRSKILLNDDRFDIKYIIPVIITLNESILFIEQVPIVPIEKLSNFLEEFKGYTDLLLMINKEDL